MRGDYFFVLALIALLGSCGGIPTSYEKLGKMSDSQLGKFCRNQGTKASQDCISYTTNDSSIKGCEAQVRAARENVQRCSNEYSNRNARNRN